jgi:hypothetical protein
MHKVTARQPIALPISKCWEKVRDFSRALNYVPGLTDLTITTPATSGVGASRVVVSAQFGPMDETITEWNEGRGFRIRLHRGDGAPMPPMREATCEYALEPSEDDPEGTTYIAMSMEYELSYGILGSLLNALFLQRVMQGSMSDVALSLAENYVTDERVSKARLKELRAAAR